MKLWFQRDSIPAPVESSTTSGHTVYSSERKSVSSRRWIIPVVFLFCFLEILDAVFTCWAVNQGLVWEGNHLVAQMAGHWSFILLKFTGAILSGYVLLKLHEHFPRISLTAAITIACFYSMVLVWNSNMIIHLLLSR
jgi:hypothetical protein